MTATATAATLRQAESLGRKGQPELLRALTTFRSAGSAFGPVVGLLERAADIAGATVAQLATDIAKAEQPQVPPPEPKPAAAPQQQAPAEQPARKPEPQPEAKVGFDAFQAAVGKAHPDTFGKADVDAQRRSYGSYLVTGLTLAQFTALPTAERRALYQQHKAAADAAVATPAPAVKPEPKPAAAAHTAAKTEPARKPAADAATDKPKADPLAAYRAVKAELKALGLDTTGKLPELQARLAEAKAKGLTAANVRTAKAGIPAKDQLAKLSDKELNALFRKLPTELKVELLDAAR